MATICEQPELACTYAALILNDDGAAVTAEKINSILKAADVNVESFWPGLFARMAASIKIQDLIVNPGASASAGVAAASAAPAAGAAPAAAAPAKKEEKKPASEEEDMGLSLFD